MRQQPSHLCRGEYLDLALSHLVGPEALRCGLLIDVQPAFILGEIEQRDNRLPVIVLRHRPSLEAVQVGKSSG